MPLLLLVEDNEDLAFGVSRSLEAEGHTVELAADGAIAVEKALALKPALMILDLMLPEMSGFDVLKKVRAAGLTMPVLILTARGEETDKLHGFRLGADDYVTKPFSVSELVARVTVHLRRSAVVSVSGEMLAFGDVVVTPVARTVTRDGHSVSLTPREYDLLLKFLERPGVVYTRQRLLNEVWGYQADVQTRTVDLHVAELRRKLEADAAEPKHFITVWKTGYRLDT
jgi:two-component system alkaline phosphatase synthesis response regulator PhoP